MRQFPPSRIVCLTEETVETLYLLGEQDRIVGVSGYAVRPPQVRREKPRVSAFTSADVPKIRALEPDLVLTFSDLQAEIAAELIGAGIAVHAFNVIVPLEGWPKNPSRSRQPKRAERENVAGEERTAHHDGTASSNCLADFARRVPLALTARLWRLTQREDVIGDNGQREPDSAVILIGLGLERPLRGERIADRGHRN